MYLVLGILTKVGSIVVSPSLVLLDDTRQHKIRKQGRATRDGDIATEANELTK